MFAHQGGWDEILLVLGPIGVVVGLLAVVRSRLAKGPPDDPDTVPRPGPPGEPTRDGVSHPHHDPTGSDSPGRNRH